MGGSISNYKIANSIFLILFMIGTIFGLNYSFCDQTKLAGNAIFPDKQYTEWLKTQQDPSLEVAEKIKSTINTYLLLWYESWAQDLLFDFGFLFNKDMADAREEYAYQRGLLYLFMARMRYYDHRLTHYEYNPKFMEFIVDEKKATVKIWPDGYTVCNDTPDLIGPSMLDNQTLAIVQSGECWLIEGISSKAERQRLYPHGIDFDELVATMAERIAAAEAEAEANVAKLRGDPHVEMRLKAHKKMIAEEKRRNDERLMLYQKISGEYHFDGEGKMLRITFFVKDNYLVGKIHESDDEAILQQVDTQILKFQFRPNMEKVYKLQFLEDSEGKISQCILDFKGTEHKGVRIK